MLENKKTCLVSGGVSESVSCCVTIQGVGSSVQWGAKMIDVAMLSLNYKSSPRSGAKFKQEDS